MQNVVVIQGRLTANPETPVFKNKRVFKCRIASGKSVKEGDTWVNGPNTCYIDADMWENDSNGKMLDLFMRVLVKGSPVLIQGVLVGESWADKTTGEKKSKHKIQITNLTILDYNKSETTKSEGTTDEESLPF